MIKIEVKKFENELLFSINNNLFFNCLDAFSFKVTAKFILKQNGKVTKQWFLFDRSVGHSDYRLFSDSEYFLKWADWFQEGDVIEISDAGLENESEFQEFMNLLREMKICGRITKFIDEKNKIKVINDLSKE